MSNKGRGGIKPGLRSNPGTIVSEGEMPDGSGVQAVTLTAAAWKQMDQIVDSKVNHQLKLYESKSKINFDKQFKTVTDNISDVKKRLGIISDTYKAKIDEIEAKLSSDCLPPDENTKLQISAIEAKIDHFISIQTEKNKCDKLLTYHALFKITQREQRERGWSLRVKNWQSPWCSKPMNTEDIYNSLFKPVLDGLIAKGDAPNFNTSYLSCIEYAHPLGSNKKGISPHIFRFHSRRTLYFFMLNKKPHMEFLALRAADKNEWNDAAVVKFDNTKKLKVSHDLAELNRSIMTFLYSSGVALKCKVTSFGVSFVPKQNQKKSDKWIRICNPFSSTLEGLVTPLPPVHDLLESSSLILDYAKTNNSNNKDYFKDLAVDLQSLLKAADQQQGDVPDAGEDPLLRPEAADSPVNQDITDYPAITAGAGSPANTDSVATIPVVDQQQQLVSAGAGSPATTEAVATTPVVDQQLSANDSSAGSPATTETVATSPVVDQQRLAATSPVVGGDA